MPTSIDMLGVLTLLGTAIFSMGLIFSFYGYGRMIHWCVLSEWPLGVGLTTVIGMSCIVVVGGFLNLFMLISPIVWSILLVIGLAMAFFLRPKVAPVYSLFLQGWNSKLIILFIPILLFFVFGIISCLYMPYMSNIDDAPAYGCYPFKMMQMGGMGLDPFNKRAALGMGAHSFLQSSVLIFFDDRAFGVLDPLMAQVLIFLVLISTSSNSKIANSKPLALLFSVLLTSGIYIHFGNLSSNYILSLACLALYQMLVLIIRHDHVPLRLGLFYGLLLSFSLCLKNSAIVAVAPITTVGMIYALKRHGLKHTAQLFSSAFFFAMLFMLPWMLNSYRNYQTLFFPVLGKGSFQNLDMPVAKIFHEVSVDMNDPVMWTSFFFVFLVTLFNFMSSKELRWMRLILSVALCGVAFLLYIKSDGLYRYGAPFVMAAVLIQGRHVLELSSRWELWHTYMLIIGLGMIFFSWCQHPIGYWLGFKKTFVHGIKNHSILSERRLEKKDHLQRLADQIPKNTITLVRHSDAYLLPFEREKKFFIIDWAHEFSPPPGMPITDNLHVLVDYLKAQGITYIAYSHFNEGGFPVSSYGYLANINQRWVQLHSRNTFHFQKMLREMMLNYQLDYLDEQSVLINLTRMADK